MVERRCLSDDERVAWLRLSRSESVGPKTFLALIRRYGSAHDALARLPELARRGGRTSTIKICSAAEARREIEALEARGGSLLALCEPAYPPRLAAIEDPPPVLAALGRPELLNRPIIAIVGARNASANGRTLARRFAAELGAQGYVVVSGLALGIDASAHDGALETGTIAVMGCGVDTIYPKNNAPLYRAIAERGAALSELPCGTEPRAQHFPRRNRIISGLARGTIVVEAAKRSGSLITARLAAEQGREVFAVPRSPLDSRSAGPNDLIRQGATLVESAADVLDALESGYPVGFAEPEIPPFGAQGGTEPSTGMLDEARPRLRELLGPTPTSVDELIRQSQLTPSIVVTILLELELAGRLERHPGNQVSIIAPDI